jgi:hypothetical protein
VSDETRDPERQRHQDAFAAIALQLKAAARKAAPKKRAGG